MISIIVATAENGVIGHGNKIPWHLPRDLKHFAAKTKGHHVLMGMKTYESIIDAIGKPLPDRHSIVLSDQKDFKAPGCTIVRSWDEALKEMAGKDVFVAGGAMTYKLALPHADRLLLTVIHTKVDGDATFKFDKNEWNLVSEEFHAKDEKNKLDCTFYEYERKR